MADKRAMAGEYVGNKPRHLPFVLGSDRFVGPGGETIVRKLTTSKDFTNNGQTLTVAEIDYAHVYVNTAGGVTALTLPTPTAAEDGLVSSFKRLGPNVFTLNGPIDGGSSKAFAADQDAIELVYIHSLAEWHITSQPSVGGGGSLWTDLGSILQPTGGESIQIPAGTWDGAHFILGTYHFWMTTNGVLMVKSSAPTGENDGTPVGTQSWI
jgi:hypothetical protein